MNSAGSLLPKHRLRLVPEKGFSRLETDTFGAKKNHSSPEAKSEQPQSQNVETQDGVGEAPRKEARFSFRRRHWYWTRFVVTVVAVAVLIGTFVLTTSFSMSREAKNDARLSKLEKSFDEFVDATRNARAETRASVTTIKNLVAQQRNGPSLLAEATDLLKRGEYAKAEAAFTLYARVYPNSRLLDDAYAGAAVAAARLGNCILAKAHANRVANQSFLKTPAFLACGAIFNK
jgi:TolA-binding protein